MSLRGLLRRPDFIGILRRDMLFGSTPPIIPLKGEEEKNPPLRPVRLRWRRYRWVLFPLLSSVSKTPGVLGKRFVEGFTLSLLMGSCFN